MYFDMVNLHLKQEEFSMTEMQAGVLQLVQRLKVCTKTVSVLKTTHGKESGS